MSETLTMTLTDFLLARIADDEEVAQLAVDAPFHADEAGRWVLVYYDHEGYGPTPIPPTGSEPDPHDLEWAVHASRHDPARVLAECTAKRRIVEMHHDGGAFGWCAECDGHPPCDTLCALASIYAEHPDYDESWRS